VDTRSGSMHADRAPVRDLYYGVDESNLYLRVDFNQTTAFTSIELRTQEHIVSLLNNGNVLSAQRKILEVRIPFNVLGTSRNQPLKFKIAFEKDGIPVEVVPPERWIEVFCGESAEQL
jgi:hypothetical protein